MQKSKVQKQAKVKFSMDTTLHICVSYIVHERDSLGIHNIHLIIIQLREQILDVTYFEWSQCQNHK